MSKLRNMRLVEIPRFRAVSSGEKTLDEIFDSENSFQAWVNVHEHLLREKLYEPLDFLWHEGGDISRSVWVLAVKEQVTAQDVAPYSLLDFPGGMFLVATGDESDPIDLEETVSGMYDWIRRSDVFEYGDFPPSGMCNMPNPDGALDRALGIAQQQIFLPLKRRAK
ncbi:MAG: GyrI-like domain-containing protein [Aristaeellaceae bacterium]